MNDGQEWTSVHYKVLELSYDETRLPELCGLHQYWGFPPWGKDVVPATTVEETRTALEDLLTAGAVRLVRSEFVSEGALVRYVDVDAAAAVEILADESAWDEEAERGWNFEIVPGDEADALFAALPQELNPHRPARVVTDADGTQRLVEASPPPP